MAGEFCKYFPEEDYCKILGQCANKELAPEGCRPNKCPFEEKRGCIVASTCLKKDVIQQYKEALAS